ncbi:hypothetical protein CYMTET_14166 [Cymbomonas tetramitiformis]|uniref:Carrier domain-containing protein n=1 Tax=Cymbomonas tetramitiformis TaxID=36881 RepID=A0AAE0GH63_9CHLO|nr:hypothetical protein CYMTET_14166 [Cymbomonas tetramitiformis]
MTIPQVSSNRSGAALVASTLKAIDATHIFGASATQNLRLHEALVAEGLLCVHNFNETAAAFAALSASASNGGLSILSIASSPGVTAALPGIVQASKNQVPMLILIAGLRAGVKKAFQTGDLNSLSILAPYCKGTYIPDSGDDIPSTIVQAALLSRQGKRGPVAIDIPADFLTGVHHFQGLPTNLIQLWDQTSSRCSNSVSPWLPASEAPPLEEGLLATASSWQPLMRALGRTAPQGTILCGDFGFAGVALQAADLADLVVVVLPGADVAHGSLRVAVPSAVGCARHCSRSGKVCVAVTDARGFCDTSLEISVARTLGLPIVVLLLEPLTSGTAPAPGVEALAAAMRMRVVGGNPVAPPVSGEGGPTSGEHGGAALLHRAFDGAGVTRVLASSGGGRDLQALLAGLDLLGLATTTLPNELSAALCADGYARAGVRGKALAAVVLDMGAAGARMLPHAALAGVGEALLGSVPMLVVLLGDPGEPGFEALKLSAEEVCKGPVPELVGGVEDVELAVVSAAALAHQGCPGPVAVALPRSAVLDPRLGLPAPVPPLPLLRAGAPDTPGLLPAGQLAVVAERVAEALLSATHPRFHLGMGASSQECCATLLRVAEAVGSTVTTTWSGKGAFPETHPLALWPGLGAAIPLPLRAIADEADCVVVVGARLGQVASSYYHAQLPPRCFHVDVDPAVAGANFAAEPVLADAERFAAALWEALGGRRRAEPPSLRDELAAAHAAVLQSQRPPMALSGAAPQDGPGSSAASVIAALQTALPEGTVFTAALGPAALAAAEQLCLLAPGRFLTPCDSGVSGFALPAAVGAALRLRRGLAEGAPAIPVVALLGEEEIGCGWQVLRTAQELRLPVIAVLLHDDGLGLGEVLRRAAGGSAPSPTPRVSALCGARASVDPAEVAAAMGLPMRAADTVERSALSEAAPWISQAVAAHPGPAVLDMRAKMGPVASAEGSFYVQGVVREVAAAVGSPGGGHTSVTASPRMAAAHAVDSSARSSLELLTPATRSRGVVPPRRAGSRSADFARRQLAECRQNPAACDVWGIAEHARVTHAPRGRLAAVDGKVRRGYAELCGRMAALGQRLMAAPARVARGERVGVLLPNSVECLEAHYAVAAVRGLVLNLNYRLAASELGGILEDAEPVAIIAHASYRALLASALAELSTPLRLILWVGEDQAEGGYHGVAEGPYEECLAGLVAGQYPTLAVPPGGCDEGCEMYYTSGTTGKPKGIVLSSKVVVLHALGCMVEHRIHEGEVWGHFAPMFHLVDAYAMFAVTWLGGVHVMQRAFSAAETLDLIEREQVTATNVAATMVTMLLAHPGVEARDLGSLELVSCGGAPLNRVEVLRALEVLQCEFFLSYGMSECCGKITMSLLDPEMRVLPEAEQLEYLCTSGRPFTLTEVRVVDVETEKDVAADGVAVGEVWIRGDTVMKGYWRNETATASAFAPGGWFKTGDLATVEHRGYITVCDRKKDMILTGSENVFAMEVELTLANLPQVKYACVYGVPDRLLGELVKAVIVLHPEHTGSLSAAQIRQLAAASLADYKVPRQVEFLEEHEMPLTGSGKVAKAALKSGDSERRERRRGAPAATAGTAAAKTGVVDVSAKKEEAPVLMRRRGKKEDPHVAPLCEHTYVVQWGTAPVPARSVPRSASWLLLADEGGVATALQALVSRSSPAAMQMVGPGEAETELLGGGESAAAQVRELAAGGTLHVVCLWALDGRPDALGAASTVVAATERVCQRLLQLLQLLARVRASCRLWLVTRGAAVEGWMEAGGGLEDAAESIDDIGARAQRFISHPVQQAVWGLARVVTAEMPRVRCNVVDLCPCEPDPTHDARALASELAVPWAAEAAEAAWRRRQRFAPALQHIDGLQAIRCTRFDSDAAYVVTGGLGGLGLQWAAHLARWGAGEVFLVSRRLPSAEVVAQLALLQQRTGCSLVVKQGDIAKQQDVVALLEAVKAGAKECRGIFHLAGVVDDGTAEQLTWERFQKVLSAKVDGSMHLHETAVRLELPLQHFTLFSSVYGLLGYRELTHYAAANAFQDGLALARRAAGLPGNAVSWGTWAGAGMAHGFGSGFEAYWTGQGMRFVDLQRGMATLHALLVAGVPHAAVLPAEWPQYAQRRGATGVHPLLRALAAPHMKPAAAAPAATATPSPAAAGPAPGTPAARLAQVAAAERLAVLQAEVCGVVSALLGGDGAVDATAPVVELGLSSMLVVDLMTQLGELYDLDLSPTLVYEAVHIHGLCQHVLQEMNIPEQLAPAAAAAAPVPLVDDGTAVGKLRVTPPGERLDIMTIQVGELLGEFLGEEAAGAPPTTPLVELGLTSMLTIDLISRLADLYDLPDLSPTLVYEAVHIRGVCAAILEDLQLPVAVTATIPSLASEGALVALHAELPSIGVAGLACRLPGGANTLMDFWEGVLLAGRDCVIDPPAGRPTNGRRSGFLSPMQVACFDRAAFGITEGEAMAMDPQQRLLLECARECFEDAGHPVSAPAARAVGVYVALETMDYAVLHQRCVWYPSDGYCLFEGVGDSSAAGSIYVQCLGAFSPAGGLVVDSHFMGYWWIAVNGDGHWNDLDDGMWLSLWYPSDGYCLFEGVGDSSAAGSIYVQCLGAFSPAGGLVVDSHFMGWVLWMMGLWLSLWYPSGGYCLFEGVGDSSAAGSIYVQCLGAFSPAGGLVFDSHFMGYWRIAVNGDGHWNDLDDGMWLSLWYPSVGYCLFEGAGDSSAAGSIYVQCLGAFSPAGGLVIDTHFMGYWHLVVNGDGHWNDLDDGIVVVPMVPFWRVLPL